MAPNQMENGFRTILEKIVFSAFLAISCMTFTASTFEYQKSFFHFQIIEGCCYEMIDTNIVTVLDGWRKLLKFQNSHFYLINYHLSFDFTNLD